MNMELKFHWRWNENRAQSIWFTFTRLVDLDSLCNSVGACIVLDGSKASPKEAWDHKMWQKPIMAKKVRFSLDLTNFYNKFIKGFLTPSRMNYPLNGKMNIKRHLWTWKINSCFHQCWKFWTSWNLLKSMPMQMTLPSKVFPCKMTTQ